MRGYTTRKAQRALSSIQEARGRAVPWRSPGVVIISVACIIIASFPAYRQHDHAYAEFIHDVREIMYVNASTISVLPLLHPLIYDPGTTSKSKRDLIGISLSAKAPQLNDFLRLRAARTSL